MAFPNHPSHNVRPHISKPLLRFLNDLSRRGAISVYEATSCYPCTYKTLRKLEAAGVVTIEEAA